MEKERDIRFGRYRLHSVQGLFRGAHAVHVTPKSLALLQALAERAGQVVTKDELLQRVWPNVLVTEASLSTCIQELRTVLRDDARHPRFIETVHRRGYRFVGGAGVSDANRGTLSVATAPPTEPIVGREPALEQLMSAFAQVRTGARQIIFVSGEAGIGKTALAETFILNVPIDAAARITRGECVERYGVGEAYQPMLEALTRLCLQPCSGPLVAALRRFAPTWLSQLPALQTPAEQRLLQRRTAGVTPARMLRELTDVFEAMTAETPIVLFLDDLHWSDVSTLDWLSAFARRREPARVLVIAAYRSDEKTHASGTSLQGLVDTLRVKKLCREIGLGGLSEAAVVEYVLDRHPPAEQQLESLEKLARLVQRHTDGNPLFIVNVMRDLVSRRLLSERDGQWSAQSGIDAASLRIPDDVRRTIELQVDRLDAHVRDSLTVASICGSTCAAPAIAAGAAVSVETVEAGLGALARQHLFVREIEATRWPDGTIAANFEFLHALYREVLAGRISPVRTAELHRLIGTRLESAYGERASEIAAALAMHFDQAHDTPRAISYLQHAATTDTLRGAHREAHVHLRRALTLLEAQIACPERDAREVALRSALGTVLISLQGFGSPEVEGCFSRARQLTGRVGSAAECLPILWGLWVYYLDHGPLSTAREIANEMSELARQAPDSAHVLQAHHAQWPTMFLAGDMAATEDYTARAIAVYDCERHAALASKYGAHDPGVCARIFRARAAVLAGRTQTSVCMSEEAIAHARELAQPFTLALALVFAAFVNLARRDTGNARQYAQSAGAIAREHSFILVHGWSSVIEGWAAAADGDDEPGIDLMREGVARARANGSSLYLPLLLGVLAEAELKSGRLSESCRTLADARAVAMRTGDLVSLSELDRVTAELYLAGSADTQAYRQAEQHLLAALERSRAQGTKLLELRTANSLVRAWLASGMQAEARELLLPTCTLITEERSLPDLEDSRQLLAQL